MEIPKTGLFNLLTKDAIVLVVLSGKVLDVVTN